MNLRRWLTVGIGVKRWLLVAFIGLIILALGVAHVVRQMTAALPPDSVLGNLLNTLTLQSLPYELRGLILGTLGAILFLAGGYRLVRALVDPFALWDRELPMVEVIYQKRFLARGPRVVAMGGGTGLSTLLRGLKEHTSNLTAVVTVADDGGSTGVLRTELGIPAVGDIRNCIVALADAEPLMGQLLQYRFPGVAGATVLDAPPSRDQETPPSSLGGHAIGNLLLAALVDLEGGDFEEAVREMNRVLAVRGRVVPATGAVLTLHARLDDGSEVIGQSRIAKADKVDRVWVTPEDCSPTEDALRAIADAELIVLGPGLAVHEHPSRASRARDRRGHRGVGGARRVRLQRRDPARRDRRLRPRGPSRRAGPARRRASRGRRAGQQPVQRDRAARLGGGARPPPMAAGRWPGAAAGPRRPRGPGERAPPLARAARDGHHVRLGARGRAPTPSRGRPRRAHGLTRRRWLAPIATSSQRCGRSWRPSTPPGPATGMPRSRGSARDR